MSTYLQKELTEEDRAKLIDSINYPNIKFGQIVMTICSKYQVFDAQDINVLLNRKECRVLFSSDYAMLRLINNPADIKNIVKDTTGRNRYYLECYEFNNKQYVFTSQLYGYGGESTHNDNRTPFYNWILSKFKIDVGKNNMVQMQEEEPDMITIKKYLNCIKAYINYHGFTYPDNLIENFYLSLKSKPFVILAGTSGTGKTRLVRLFAEAINAEYKLVPVRPDWSDSSDLFGHLSLNGDFVSGTINDFISHAIKNPNKPHFLCLDEMNLARVEYYFSDFLSIIETRKWEGDRITTDSIELANKTNINLPDNLYVIGTVNMDETTFPFSKKVLDRANTIEFNYVDLLPSTSAKEKIEPIEVNNQFLKSKYLKLIECSDESSLVESTCIELQSINKILQKANLHIGYRVRDEIVFYILNNQKDGSIIDNSVAFDNQILQKILPRIQGSSESIHRMMYELFVIFNGGYSIKYDDSTAEKMQKSYEENKRNKVCKYSESAKKLQMMTQRFEEDGFTSYWV